MYDNRKLSVCGPNTSNMTIQMNDKMANDMLCPGTLHLLICVSNEHVPMMQCVLETWTEQGVWKLGADGTLGSGPRWELWRV